MLRAMFPVAHRLIPPLAVLGLVGIVAGCGSADAPGAPASFTCQGDGTAIPSAKRCDGSYDCYDNSDEMGCPVAATSPGDPTSGGTAPPVSPKLQTPEACEFDESRIGLEVGDHAANFIVRDEWDDEFALHSVCGGGKQAIWIILAAQW